LATKPKTATAAYVSDPSFDFGAQGGRIDLMRELTERDPKATAVLEREVVSLLSHFGAHSRNLVRAALAGK